jgi:trk system potassium uptake protein TrkH
MVLIQLGGLGIMTFSVFLFLFIGKRLGLRERWIINESFTPTPIREIRKLVGSIFVFTITAETIGAALLFLVWRKEMAPAPALFTSVFHSVSSFCNAGFSFFNTSFVRYQGNILLTVTVMTLIVVGGLGFPVMYEFASRIRRRNRRIKKSFSLHSKMVITTTFVLITIGAVLIFLLERNGELSNLPARNKVLTVLFQSVTTRTAGFNTIDISSLGPATLFILVILMFIGASPGSTGGGIKTTSLAVFAAIIYNRFAGRESVSIFKRTVPSDTVTRALSIFILAILTVIGGLILLLVTQMDIMADNCNYMLSYLFEAVSAFGTVGLSMGVTSSLNTIGKVIVIVLMFLGRVGLLTVAYVVTRRMRLRYYRYAEEKVMIG